MGWTNKSDIQNEVLSRCKLRIQFMKEAVSSHKAFASAHFGYALCLKNAGASLTDYISDELSHHSSSIAAPDTPRIYIPRRLLSFPTSQDPEMESDLATKELELEAQDSRNRRALLETHQQDPLELDLEIKLTVPLLEAQMNRATLQRAVSMPEMELQTDSNWMGPTVTGALEFEARNISNRRALQETGEHDPQEPVSLVELTMPLLETQMNPATLQRALSMPEVKLNTESNWMGPTAIEELEFSNRMETHRKEPASLLELQMRPIKKLVSTGKSLDLIQIFYILDNQFLKAAEGAHEVSKILASKLGHHSNFGHIDHPTNAEENATHSALLGIILAWEEKLYDELKAGETMKHEYQKKIASLTKKDKQGSDLVSYEKVKAAATNVYTRYIVNVQSVDSTVAKINCIRDEQLYPKILQLLDRMATMWETMRYNHEIQAGIVHALRSLDSFQPLEETSKYCHDRITQLFAVVREWYTQFCRLIDCQKDHARALYSWLNVNLIPIESNIEDKVSSPPRDRNPPIYELVKAWNDGMDKLPDEIARSAIRDFASVILSIIQREEETKMREKCDAERSHLDRKSRQYEVWCMRNGVNEELDSENALKIAKEEREHIVMSLKQQLEDLQKMFRQEREKYLARLRHQLLDLFRAMSEIALACSVMYSNLRFIAENKRESQNS